MVPSILFLSEVVAVVELIEVDHFSRIFDLLHVRHPPGLSTPSENFSDADGRGFI